jgi:NAD(P)-dependent dehydrogenase (short-subunit alcohol dehydrogenase family)
MFSAPQMSFEETAELVTAAGGTGIAVQVDHLEPDEVRALVARIDAEQGRLDVLVMVSGRSYSERCPRVVRPVP